MNLEKEGISYKLAICNFCDNEFHWSIIIEKLFFEKFPKDNWWNIPGGREYREKLNEDYYIYDQCIVYNWNYNDGAGQLAICKKHWIKLFELFE